MARLITTGVPKGKMVPTVTGNAFNSNIPPPSKVPLLPKKMNMPFWQRVKEWWTE